MKAHEARKICEESLEHLMREDVVCKMLDNVFEKIERCSKRGVSTTTYHFAGWLWPFARHFPNFIERAVFIERLRGWGYRVEYEVRGLLESNSNTVKIEW